MAQYFHFRKNIVLLSWILLDLFNVIYSSDEEISSNSYKLAPNLLANAIYDLNNDPYEDNNVYSLSEYRDILSTFEERRIYWNDLTQPENGPDNTLKYDTWDQCGRVCPWLDEENIKTDKITETVKVATIEQKYFYADAPHIVYVLIDDWGYNSLGSRSNFLHWTTPTIDKLASHGILLENYYTDSLCTPSRASLLTGRYSLRTGVYVNSNELPTTEITLAQELKSAGYRNYIVGKWDQGHSKKSLFPTERGFDYFYGFMNGYTHYWHKTYDGYIDLFENTDFITDKKALDESYHSAYLYQTKVEEIIKEHSEKYQHIPMFLYYSMQLVHSPWTAPVEYLERCDRHLEYIMTDDEHYQKKYAIYNYCGLNLMMDEAIANLTCTLTKYGYGENTILILAGDNGGEETIDGVNYPYKGWKETSMRGGLSNTAIIHSNLIDESVHGTVYSYPTHITDWLPTLMRLATNNQWVGSYGGMTIDGYNIWDHVLSNTPSERKEIVFLSSPYEGFSMQINNIKYMYQLEIVHGSTPSDIFSKDLDPKQSKLSCSNPMLIPDYTSSYIIENTMVYLQSFLSKNTLQHASTVDVTFTIFSIFGLFAVAIVGMIILYHSRNIVYQRKKDSYNAMEASTLKNKSETDPLL